MNQWQYAVLNTATKVASHITMGKGLTIESVFLALKPNELLIRTHARNPKNRAKFIGDAQHREWATL